jgi:hypothetical protein
MSPITLEVSDTSLFSKGINALLATNATYSNFFGLNAVVLDSKC